MWLRRNLPRLSILISVAFVTLLGPLAVASFADDPTDFDIAGGHFYGQANGQGGTGATGYTLADDSQARLWSEFKRLGRVSAVGYPTSQRFSWDGFISQAMQRVVLQWRPETAQAAFVNVFDLMSRAGNDDWLLAARQVPKAADWSSDSGKSWDAVVAAHLAVLDANPAIKAKYYDVVGDPVQMNGLPMAPITDMGNVYVLRAQRVVIQQWKEDVPWARKGEVTVALGGDIAKEAGLLPADAAIPQPMPAVSAPVGAPTVKSGTLAGDETWAGVIEVSGDVIVPQGATLTIKPGTTVKFEHNRDAEDQLTMDSYNQWPKLALTVYGTLLAQGTRANMITFTSDAPDPRGADWKGIIIRSESPDPRRRSIISYAIVEYAHKSILFANSPNGPHLIENSIVRFADHVFRKARGGREYEGGSAVTHYDGSSVVTGNILYGNTHALEIGGNGTSVIENNVVAFNQKRGNYFGGANGVRTWGADASPVFRNNLFYKNWWGVEFNWGTNAIFENNIVSGNEAGLVIAQGDPSEKESNPVANYNDVLGNGVNFLHDRYGRRSTVGAERFGHGNVSIDASFTDQDFYNANFDLTRPALEDAGNPDLRDADGSRSDIGPRWDWGWVTSSLLTPVAQ